MTLTTGFNHVATLTTDMDLTVSFYEKAFDATVTFEVAKRDDHPWMKILDLGSGAALNVFEVPADRHTRSARAHLQAERVEVPSLSLDHPLAIYARTPGRCRRA